MYIQHKTVSSLNNSIKLNNLEFIGFKITMKYTKERENIVVKNNYTTRYSLQKTIDSANINLLVKKSVLNKIVFLSNGLILR